MGDAYLDFLRAKVAQAERFGFDIEDGEINPIKAAERQISMPTLFDTLEEEAA